MFRILFLLLLLFMTAVSGGGYWLYKYDLTAPFPLYTNLRYTVEPKMTLSQVAKDFMEKRLLNYPSALAWVTLARWQKRAHKIKAGEYLIRVGMTPQEFLEIMIMGKTTQHSIMLLEGWNFRQVMNHIEKHPQIIKKLDETKDYAAIMAQLGQPNQHPEGRFYPDTYYFPTGTSDIEFLQRAYEMMASELKTAWEKRDKEIPLKTADEALILASLIEKETGMASERPIIAGVFMRRLKKNMFLQTDPTVIYALGESFDGNIRKRDLKIDNPYNTYVNKGLPPTPIAMPGRAALLAAVNPSDGKSLFFVAKGDGSHYFSKTYREHECAVIEYQLKDKSPRRYRQRCRKYPNCPACRH